MYFSRQPRSEQYMFGLALRTEDLVHAEKKEKTAPYCSAN
jgi:hypothetical protein